MNKQEISLWHYTSHSSKTFLKVNEDELWLIMILLRDTFYLSQKIGVASTGVLKRQISDIWIENIERKHRELLVVKTSETLFGGFAFEDINSNNVGIFWCSLEHK
jgi:hypothetical protein